MKVILLSLVFCFFLSRFSAAAEITLAERGKTAYSIVLGENASPSERHGAKELQVFLQIISGAFFPIAFEAETGSGPAIFLGESRRLSQVDKSIDFPSFGNEGFIIKTSGEHLILAGGKLRGSMYAVYSFLEDILGCRWYSSEVSKIPRTSTLVIPQLDKTEMPAFEYREPYWKDALDKDWAARNRCNSSASGLDSERGGKVNYRSVHTFYPRIPPEKHYGNHPEWYSVLSNKKRTWEYGQLCLTNPEVVKKMADEVMKWMERDPEGNIFSVSQNDWHVACECPPCAEVDDYEGSHSGTLVHFVNGVAERTAKRFPDKFVGTLAYTYTEVPPKYARPNDHVVIRLCNMNHLTGCDGHPLTECPLNFRYRDNLIGWSKIADKIYIWDYVTNFAHFLQPMPLWYANKKDLQFYSQNGVDGIFEQGCTPTEAAAGAELTAWLEAKLLWNPEHNLDELMNDFITGYYGVAAEPMNNYHRFLMRKTNEDNIHFTLYSPTNIALFGPENMKVMDGFLKEAETLAANEPEIAYRVEEVRLDWQYLKLNQPIRHVLENGVYKPVDFDAEYSTPRALELFMDRINDHEISELWEFRGNDLAYRYMRANTGTHKVLAMENPFFKLTLIPGIGGRIYQAKHKKSGREIFRVGETKERFYPTVGGYSDPFNSDGPWAFFGIDNYAYTIEDSPAEKIFTMQCQTYNWYVDRDVMEIAKDVILSDNSDEVRIRTELKLLEDLGRPQSILTMPDLNLGRLEDVRVGLPDAGGKYSFEKLPEPADWGFRYKTFRGREISQGKWCVINIREKWGIENTFDPKQVESCTIWANPQTGSLQLRLETFMKPGNKDDTIMLDHRLKVIENTDELPR